MLTIQNNDHLICLKHKIFSFLQRWIPFTTILLNFFRNEDPKKPWKLLYWEKMKIQQYLLHWEKMKDPIISIILREMKDPIIYIVLRGTMKSNNFNCINPYHYADITLFFFICFQHKTIKRDEDIITINTNFLSSGLVIMYLPIFLRLQNLHPLQKISDLSFSNLNIRYLDLIHTIWEVYFIIEQVYLQIVHSIWWTINITVKK